MHTITAVKIGSQLKAHEKVRDKLNTVSMEIHVLACQDLLHCATHGDVSLMKHLYDTLGGDKGGPARTATIKQWFVLMSGDQLTAAKGEWKLKKGWKPEGFKLEEAENTPFWTLNPEKEQSKLSLEAILGMLKGFSKRIDSAVEKDTFNGDPDKAKALIAQVVSFADEKAKRLTPQERGEISDTADKILKDGVVTDKDKTPELGQPEQDKVA